MSKEIKLTAERRTEEESGKGPARRLRRTGWLPAAIYTDKGVASSVRLNRHALDMMLRQHTSENVLVDLAVDGDAPCKVLVREIQRHPVTGAAMHVDFVQVSMTRKMRVHVPVVLTGSPAGVQEGGNLEHMLREIELECLPGDLVEKIEVDVTALKIGDNILVSELKLAPTLTIVTPGSVAVAGVAAMVAEEEVAPEAAVGEAAAAEPELVGDKGKKEEEATEAAGEKEKGKEKGKAKEKQEK